MTSTQWDIDTMSSNFWIEALFMQYMIYIEICRKQDGDLWNSYKGVVEKRKNFEIGKIDEVGDIWKVFQEFFKSNRIICIKTIEIVNLEMA